MAADQGLEEAQYQLGNMCEEGRGVEKSVLEAVRWYTSAAEQDNEEARSRLALLVINGDTK
jgi:TPR repeat protein